MIPSPYFYSTDIITNESTTFRFVRLVFLFFSFGTGCQTGRRIKQKQINVFFPFFLSFFLRLMENISLISLNGRIFNFFFPLHIRHRPWHGYSLNAAQFPNWCIKCKQRFNAKYRYAIYSPPRAPSNFTDRFFDIEDPCQKCVCVDVEFNVQPVNGHQWFVTNVPNLSLLPPFNW